VEEEENAKAEEKAPKDASKVFFTFIFTESLYYIYVG